jgi:hypothetical protein
MAEPHARVRALFNRSGPHSDPKPCEACGLKPKYGLSNHQLLAHHEDYRKPLSVRWLCQSHHGARHSELRRARKERRSRTPFDYWIWLQAVIIKNRRALKTERVHRAAGGK